MSPDMRRYKISDVEPFQKTRDRNGAFSNMAGGMPILVCGIEIRSTEAYYQAMKFPDHPQVQELVLRERSPMIAKRVAYEHQDKIRSDWLKINVPVMRHALRLRHAHHRETMTELFIRTEDRPIVEISMRDDFWGAKPTGDGWAIGRNVLGRLWMEVRQQASDPEFLLDGVIAPPWDRPMLLGIPVGHTPFSSQPALYQTALDL